MQRPERNSPEFLARFKAGDQAAFKDFFEDTTKAFHFSLSNTCQWATHQEVEDIVADTYVKIYNNRRTYQSYTHICASFIYIAKKLAVSYLRHRISQRKWEQGWVFITGISVGMDDYAIEQEYDQENQLSQILPKLTPTRRKVFELSFYALKTIPEIAAMMEIRQQTARNHRSRAIEDIRKFLLIRTYKSKSKIGPLKDDKEAAYRRNILATL